MKGARGDGGQRGLSLIEVMLAMLLLSYGLLAIAPLFSGSVKTGASSNQLASSNTLAREKLEEVIGYPSTDARLAVPVGANSATFPNDLPSGYNPSTGAVCPSPSFPSCPALGQNGWYIYPYTRTYTVQEFAADLTTQVTEPPPPIPPPTPTPPPPPPPPAYAVKLVTVTVRATTGPFPGLRQTRQSVFVGYRDGS